METINHLLNNCLYAKVVWVELEYIIGCEGKWNGKYVGECLENWMQNKDLKEYISLPLLSSWSIWLTCNSSIFQDKGMPSFQCESH